MRLSRRGRRRWIVAAAAILIGSIAFVLFGAVRAAQQQRLLAESRQAGLAAHAQGDLQAALNRLSYYFEQVKDDLEVNLAFADARARLPIVGGRHMFEAVDLYFTHGLRLLDQDPSRDADQSRRREILHQLLQLYGRLGQRVEALHTADRLLAIDPDCREALAAKADLLWIDRKFPEALEVLDRLMALEPANLAWRRMHLEIQGERGMRAEQRLELCRTWARDFQGDGRFHALTAALLLEASRMDEAVAELQAAAQRGADEQPVLERIVELMDLLDQRDEAERLIAATLQQRPGEQWVHETRIRRLWHAHDLDGALRALDETHAANSNFNTSLCRLRALTLLCMGRMDEAVLALAPLRESPATDQRNDVDHAWADAVAGAIRQPPIPWQERMEALNRAFALAPDDAVLCSLLGDAWTEVGEQSQAILYYQRAAELDPAWVAAGLSHANALLRAGRLDEAYAASRLVISRAPKNQLAPLLLYAKAYLAIRSTGRAPTLIDWNEELGRDLIEILEHVRDEHAANSDVAALLAEAYCQFDARDQATQFMQRVIDAEDSSPRILLALAEVARRHELPVEEALVHRAIDRGDTSLRPVLTLAEVRARQGNPDAGLALIDAWISDLPPQMSARAEAMADAMIDRVEFMLRFRMPGAVEALGSAITAAPDNVRVQQLAFALPEAWNQPDLMSRSLENLRRILGERAPQVRLAEAQFLLRGGQRDEASLAKAIVQIESVVKQSPDSLAALSLMAEALTAGPQPNVDRAVACLERAAGLYADNADTLVRLVTLLQQRGDFPRAGRHLRSVARLKHLNPQLQRAELRLWQSQGDFETALARAAAIVHDTSPVPDQLVLAAIHVQAGQREQAEEIYLRLLQNPQPDALVLSQAAEFYAETGRFARGMELVSRIVPALGMGSRDVVIGSYCRRHGRLQEAHDHLRRAVENDRRSVSARVELARLLLAMREPAGAREQALEGLKIDPENSDLRAAVAVASLRLSPQDRQQGLKSLRDLGESNADLAACLSLLEKIPYRDGELHPTDENLAGARALVEQHPGFLSAWQLAVSLHATAGKADDAIALARSAVNRFPAHAEPSQWATQLLAAKGRWMDAMAEAREWRRRAAEDPMQADVAIASLLIEMQRPAEAVQQLEPQSQVLLADRERYPDQIAVWVRALALGGGYERAAAVVEPLLTADPKWRQRWRETALMLDDAHAASALAMLDAHAGDPQEALAQAVAWIVLGRRGECAECLNRAAALTDQAEASDQRRQWKVQALMTRGQIAESRGDWTAAESSYREALKLQPNNPSTLNNLAYALASKQTGCEEALPLIERALAQQPDQPDFLDTQALVLLCLGRAAEAESLLTRAVSLRPEDPGIALSLVDARLRLNRMDGMFAAFQDLRRQIKMEKRPDRQILERFETLWRKFEQSQAAAGT